jgi:hypothetical protein
MQSQFLVVKKLKISVKCVGKYSAKEHMMRKLILIPIVAMTLLTTGCASRYGTSMLIGGATGLIVGSALAQPRTVVVQDATPVRVVTQERVVIVNEQCNRFYSASERDACARGARQRYYEEQRRRDNEAYRQGLGR